MPINLDATIRQAFQVGGVTQESADAAVVSSMHVQFGDSIQLNVALGSPANNAFNGSRRTQDVSVSISLADGSWSASNGTSGKLLPAALANIQSQAVGWRNQAEGFVTNRVLNGSQVNWS